MSPSLSVCLSIALFRLCIVLIRLVVNKVCVFRDA